MTTHPALSHHRAGAGEPLVLIHGLGSRWQLWRPVLPLLQAYGDVVAVDLPGFGATAAAPGTADVASLASHLAAFTAGLGLDTFHVAGSSLGGAVALELGRRGLARSVTAFAPVGFWGPVSRRWCQASITGARGLAGLLGPALPTLAATATGRRVLFSLFFARPGQLDPAECVADAAALWSAPGFAAARRAFAGWRFDGAALGALPDIPVTVAWGSRDAILPPGRQAARARALLPTARHVSLARCGHLPFADAPDTCAHLILSTSGLSPSRR